MCLTLLQDSRLYRFLLTIDQEFAGKVRAGGCSCGGRLHQANYERKPRGGPSDLGPENTKRLSLCCAREGCRSEGLIGAYVPGEPVLDQVLEESVGEPERRDKAGF